MFASPSRQVGFSHLEVLVAMLIVGLATPFLMAGITGSLAQTRRAYDQTAAVAWVQGQVEVLRRHCYARLRPGSERLTPDRIRPGEPPLPDGFAAALVRLEPAGDGLLRATVALYRRDWTGETPPEPPVVQTTTYVGDLRVAGQCP